MKNEVDKDKILQLIKSDNCKLALILCESAGLDKVKILAEYYENNKYYAHGMHILKIHGININHHKNNNWDYMSWFNAAPTGGITEGRGYNNLFESIANYIENE